MSTTIGPSTYLPGQTLPFAPNGTPCDENDGEEAMHLVVGESDTFGSELHHLCSRHYAQFQKFLAVEKTKLHLCDICGTMQMDVGPIRDPDEGTSGRVYDACPACRTQLLTPVDLNDDDLEPFEPEDEDLTDLLPDLPDDLDDN